MTPEEKKEAWANAQAMWEANPTMSWSDVAVIMGCSKQAVAQKANRDGWSRENSNADLNQASAALANQIDITTGKPFDEGMKLASTPDAKPRRLRNKQSGRPRPKVPSIDDLQESGRTVEEHPFESTGEVSKASYQNAIEQRAQQIVKHRVEANGGRNLLYKALRETDPKKAFDQAKLAKITLEATQILHNVERKAWGMDDNFGRQLPTYPDEF